MLTGVTAAASSGVAAPAGRLARMVRVALVGMPQEPVDGYGVAVHEDIVGGSGDVLVTWRPTSHMPVERGVIRVETFLDSRGYAAQVVPGEEGGVAPHVRVTAAPPHRTVPASTAGVPCVTCRETTRSPYSNADCCPSCGGVGSLNNETSEYPCD